MRNPGEIRRAPSVELTRIGDLDAPGDVAAFELTAELANINFFVRRSAGHGPAGLHAGLLPARLPPQPRVQDERCEPRTLDREERHHLR